MSGTNRHVLRYSADLSTDDTWRLTVVDDGIGVPPVGAVMNGVECRMFIGGTRYDVKIRLRWRILGKGVFVTPSDSDHTLWITQPAKIADGLVYRELQLERAPPRAADVMSDW